MYNFLRFLIKENLFHCLPGDIGGRGNNEVK